MADALASAVQPVVAPREASLSRLSALALLALGPEEAGQARYGAIAIHSIRAQTPIIVRAATFAVLAVEAFLAARTMARAKHITITNPMRKVTFTRLTTTAVAVRLAEPTELEDKSDFLVVVHDVGRITQIRNCPAILRVGREGNKH